MQPEKLRDDRYFRHLLSLRGEILCNVNEKIIQRYQIKTHVATGNDTNMHIGMSLYITIFTMSKLVFT